MNARTQPLVSIVVPAYNCGEFLAESMESILAQTYQNWDCIIANNCSTDRTAEIAHLYAARDARIRLLNAETFLRAAPNYNRALRHISPASKYCKIVFADDWIFPDCLDRMVALADEWPSVGIVGAYALEGREVRWTGLPYPSSMVDGREVCRQHFLNRQYVFGTATSVLYRADLVRSREKFFNESNIHSDTEACFDLLRNTDFGFVHQILTYTRPRTGSLTAISEHMRTDLPSTLHNLVRYGSDSLTSDELNSCIKRSLSDYYAFLAKSFLLRRDKSFWEFHKRKMSDEGFKFSPARLVRALFSLTSGYALNPKDSIEKLLKAVNQRADNQEKDRIIKQVAVPQQRGIKQ